MKYYFITYQAKSINDGSISIWNQVIMDNPMKFIIMVSDVEIKKRGHYCNFIILNTCEISEEEFLKYNGYF